MNLANEVSPYPYTGPAALRQPVEDALRRVVDPELAMTIVDVGLVYGVTVNSHRIEVLITMTSRACAVADMIVEDIESALDRMLPKDLKIRIELVWEPPWTSDRMSDRAKSLMSW